MPSLKTGLQSKRSKFLNYGVFLLNSAIADEKPLDVALHLGLHFFANVLVYRYPL